MTYTKNEFYEACEKVLGHDVFVRCCKANLNVPELCKEVSKAMLLNELKCSETMTLKVIQETAYNLWRADGCHHLT